MIETRSEISAAKAETMGPAQEVVPAGTALDRALELAHHLSGCGQNGIRADREAAIATIATIRLSIQDGLDLEKELCHEPAVAPEAMAGMARFAEGARDEPPRPRS